METKVPEGFFVISESALSDLVAEIRAVDMRKAVLKHLRRFNPKLATLHAMHLERQRKERARLISVANKIKHLTGKILYRREILSARPFDPSGPWYGYKPVRLISVKWNGCRYKQLCLHDPRFNGGIVITVSPEKIVEEFVAELPEGYRLKTTGIDQDWYVLQCPEEQ